MCQVSKFQSSKVSKFSISPNEKGWGVIPHPFDLIFCSIVLLYQFRPTHLDNGSDYIFLAYSSTYGGNRHQRGLTRFFSQSSQVLLNRRLVLSLMGVWVVPHCLSGLRAGLSYTGAWRLEWWSSTLFLPSGLRHKLVSRVQQFGGRAGTPGAPAASLLLRKNDGCIRIRLVRIHDQKTLDCANRATLFGAT